VLLLLPVGRLPAKQIQDKGGWVRGGWRTRVEVSSGQLFGFRCGPSSSHPKGICALLHYVNICIYECITHVCICVYPAGVIVCVCIYGWAKGIAKAIAIASFRSCPRFRRLLNPGYFWKGSASGGIFVALEWREWGNWQGRGGGGVRNGKEENGESQDILNGRRPLTNVVIICSLVGIWVHVSGYFLSIYKDTLGNKANSSLNSINQNNFVWD